MTGHVKDQNINCQDEVVGNLGGQAAGKNSCLLSPIGEIQSIHCFADRDICRTLSDWAKVIFSISVNNRLLINKGQPGRICRWPVRQVLSRPILSESWWAVRNQMFCPEFVLRICYHWSLFRQSSMLEWVKNLVTKMGRVRTLSFLYKTMRYPLKRQQCI